MDKKLYKTTAMVGFLFPIIYTLLITALGLLVDGYSPLSDSMSELGAVNSPVKHITNFGGFMFVGIGLLFYSYAFYKSFNRSLLNYTVTSLIVLAGLFMFTVSFFPCDTGCVDITGTSKWHSIISTPPAILLPIAAMLSSRLLYENNHKFPKKLPVTSLMLGFLSLMSGPMMAIGSIVDYSGLLQRLGIGFSLIWVSLISHKLLQVNENS